MITLVDILLYVLLAVVFVVLCLGVFALFKGGEFGRSWSNKLMRARVVVQFAAILVLVVGFWLKSHFAA
ncbi:twin transmembrane helix small protein [Oceanicaulis sp. MMSF_3324]|uniref:twin transmembrane helix small protein n=1 Tax=Oceanicaulis sp. MMSF_3324 TaxID=3046702 RepID=UPI00273EFD0F|nr:twin transmembrane helix small protein [Oceanicaulis sp. MMSF_3324]